MFRMIIVEDEPPILRNIRERIKAVDADFKIVGEYQNGEDALLEIHVVKPHVIMTDIRMPVMDGIEFITKVRALYPTIICAILSGYEDFEYARKAMQLKVHDYLLKPATTENIERFLRDIKKTLMHNRILVETELLRSWSIPHTPFLTNRAALENEHFYFPSYRVVYAWCPQSVPADFQTRYDELMTALLLDGERYYVFPALLSNELVGIIGVYHGSNEKIQHWLTAFMACTSLSFSYVIVTVHKLSHHLATMLEKARKAARVINCIGHPATLFLAANEDVPLISPVDLPEEQTYYLLRFFDSKRKEDFLVELKSYLKKLSSLPLTRFQWIQALQRLVNVLFKKSELPKEHLLRVEREIEEMVWQAKDSNEIESGLAEILTAFLEDTHSDEQTWVDELEQELQKNFTDNITLHSISIRYHLNPNYLSRVYSRKKQISPIDYLMQLRMEEAKRLIKEYPRLLFKEIAEKVGYSDPYYFSKLFKQYTGTTLTEYKNRLKI